VDNNSHGMTSNSGLAPRQWGRNVDIQAVAIDRSPEPPLIPPESPRLAAMFDDRSVGAEKFRVLASRLQYLAKQRPLKRVVVTSTVKGEGKSVVSANLAITLGRRHKTLLIDGDLRQSGLADLLGSNDLPGLADWWCQSVGIAAYLRRVGTFQLSCLPAGQSASQPLEIFQSQRMSEMLNHVSESFDWIIIDAPPLILADPNLLATLSDGTILVVKQGVTAKRSLRKSLESIENLKLIGIVMNGSQDAEHRYYGQYYKQLSRRPASPATVS
jgi:protein-tyrosine kinase